MNIKECKVRGFRLNSEGHTLTRTTLFGILTPMNCSLFHITNGTSWCMTNESLIPAPSRPTPMATSNYKGTLIRTQRKKNHRYCKKNKFNKNILYFLFWSCFQGGLFPKLDFGLLSPRFLRGFLPTLSPRSFFHTCQRFPISNHVTSGSYEPTILFSPLVSGFPYRK